MKKFIIVLVSIFLVVILSVVSFGVYVFAKVSDKTDNTMESVKENDYPLMYVLNREMDESTFKIDSTNQMNFDLDKEDLNELVYALMRQVHIPGVKIKGAYIDFLDNGGLHIEIPVNVYGISSCLKAGLKIKSSNGNFKFELLDARVGKFNATDKMIKKFLLKRVNSTDVETNLENKNVYCNVSMDELSVTFTKENIIKTFKKCMKEDKNADVYAILIDFLLTHDNVLKFELGDNKKVGFDLLLNDLYYNETRDDIIREPIDLNLCKTNTLQVENLNYENIAPVFNYYVSGYEALSDKQTAKVDELGLSKSYKGVKKSSKVTMKEIITNKSPKSLLEVNEAILNKEFIIDIDEKDFASIFASMDFIGTNFAFGVDNKSLMYISFESLYLDIKDDNFFINIIMNISGKRIILKANFNANRTTDNKIDAVVNYLDFGSIRLNEEYTPLLLNYLDNVMENEEWLSVDASSSLITIDLTKLITSNELAAELLKKKKESSIRFEDSSDGNGVLKLVYSL